MVEITCCCTLLTLAYFKLYFFLRNFKC